MRIIPLFLIVSVTGAFTWQARADDQKQGGRRLDVGIGAGGAADMLNLKHAPEAIEPEETSAIKMTLTCTDASGDVIKQGETGYDACMNHYKLKGDMRGPFKNANDRGTGSAGAVGGAPSGARDGMLDQSSAGFSVGGK